jgi:hypothetical protein
MVGKFRVQGIHVKMRYCSKELIYFLGIYRQQKITTAKIKVSHNKFHNIRNAVVK